ncbi:MAG: hypothetical protein KKA60_11890 [Proteobacteria bacterium]|nr:hypothetical protein [Pseudomonadota bacterium]
MASKLLCDQRDHELLAIVRETQDPKKIATLDRRAWHSLLHSHGIKELAESRGLRIAYAVAHLLASLEAGEMEDRLSALRTLRMEVVDASVGPMRLNTARVLLQIMKDLVRSPDDETTRLKLAHDFRMAATGKPRIVQAMLRRYHLLEMPEEWNQVAFDDHVHDAFSKGRKTSTHLIMDAWIKGIRRLRVIYYNHVPPGVALELLEAAAIMGVNVRIGIEFFARFRGRYAQVIWTPRGFPDTQAFLCFLAEPSVQAFMALGRKASETQQKYVFEVIKNFNRKHRQDLSLDLGVDIPPVDVHAFRAFVGAGQPSLLHLGSFIHESLHRVLTPQLEEWKKQLTEAGPGEREEWERRVRRANELDPLAIVDKFLEPDRNPDLPNLGADREEQEIPELLRLSPCQLMERLTTLHTGHRITLNLSGLAVEDVLEILYQCEGAITRLEIFNLKDHAAGLTGHVQDISRLQQAINEGNTVTLKRVILEILEKVRVSDHPDREDRMAHIREILHDLAALRAWYSATALKARMGSDSTGRGSRTLGMGLVLRDTLPRSAKKELHRQSDPPRMVVPMRITAYRRQTYIPKENGSWRRLNAFLRKIPGLGKAGYQVQTDWEVQDKSIHMATPGNILALGGPSSAPEAPFSLSGPRDRPAKPRISWTYLNSKIKNPAKVVLGFIPAFFTFYLTKDWWVLAWLGAFIWFGITLLRNILQSVLGGGGFRRSPLLKWNDFVSWDRITDSLFYTGFSVPLLDWLVKTMVLEKGLGITATTNPLILYAALALANGCYISGHNILRALPRGAVYGNFFRAILSIPIAVVVNGVLYQILASAGVPEPGTSLQKWAAIISKASSDFVAGFIEGLADRAVNLSARLRDYRERLTRIMDAYAGLELLYPETEVMELLSEPEKFGRANAEARDLEKIFILCALDLSYFWMYQPRAGTALRHLLRTMPQEQRAIFFLSQKVLAEKRPISMLFLDGLVGPDFSRALSFYLDRSAGYLRAMARIAREENP